MGMAVIQPTSDYMSCAAGGVNKHSDDYEQLHKGIYSCLEDAPPLPPEPADRPPIPPVNAYLILDDEPPESLATADTTSKPPLKPEDGDDDIDDGSYLTSIY